jgi:hypothetical protein
VTDVTREDMVSRFFALARERHSVHLRRVSGASRPWTDDVIFRQYKFTQVFRELDKTTAWFRQAVRDPMRADPRVLLATVVFRWLNRVSTGEAIFLQGHLGREGSAFDIFAETGNTDVLEESILAYCGEGPYVTGAYMIKSPTDMPKLLGMMKVIGDFWKSVRPFPAESVGDVGWREVTEMCRADATWPEPVITLESVWSWLKEFPFQGPFHAYEVVSDLRHTALLDRAPDILTWANPGPGAQRGLNRIRGRVNGSPRKPKHKWRPGGVPREQFVAEMRELLELSRDPRYWPQKVAGDAYGCDGYGLDNVTCAGPWPRWEMREVEHWLCEFDKYNRVLNGEGEPRGRYDGG